MLIGSANQITIKAIMSPRTIKESTNKLMPPIYRELKVEHSSHSSFNVDIFLLEPEKQVKIQIFRIQKFTCQILSYKLYVRF